MPPLGKNPHQLQTPKNTGTTMPGVKPPRVLYKIANFGGEITAGYACEELDVLLCKKPTCNCDGVKNINTETLYVNAL